jgi:hypothetical protein
MHTAPTRKQVIGQKLIAAYQGPLSDPIWIVEGIGPARFRSFYLVMDNGVVFVPQEMQLETVPDDAEPTETTGISLPDLLNRRLTALVRDNLYGPLVVFEGGVFLKHYNDGFYGNSLIAGFLKVDYTSEELEEFIDFWTEQPVTAMEFET